MLKLVLRNAAGKVTSVNAKFYCQNSFDFLSKTITIETKPAKLRPDSRVTEDVILKLERISLVNFGDEKGIRVVEDAISYADNLAEVNTDGVEPLFTVLENESLYLREDNVKGDISAADLLSHAEKTCENYYIVPIGNLPYVPDSEHVDIPVTSSSNGDERIGKRSAV